MGRGLRVAWGWGMLGVGVREGPDWMDGWEHMVEYKGILAACTVQAQRSTPQLEQAWGGGRGALAGRLPAACLPV